MQKSYGLVPQLKQVTETYECVHFSVAYGTISTNKTRYSIITESIVYLLVGEESRFGHIGAVFGRSSSAVKTLVNAQSHLRIRCCYNFKCQ